MTTIDLSQQPTANVSVATRLVKHLLPTLIEGTLPFAVYLLVKQTLHTSDVVALSIGGVVPAVGCVIRFLRTRTIDIMGLLILIGIVGSIAAALISGSAQLLLIRESAIGGIMGIAFLGSLLLPRPLFFYISRHFAASRDAQAVTQFNIRWSSPIWRRAYRLITAIWGIAILGEFVLRVFFVLTLPVATVLALSAVLMPAMYAIPALWTMYYLRKQSKAAQL